MASPPQRCFKFPYDEHVDKPNDTRNILLIVATLIIAVTFQAGVNPPGGVWQETTNCPNETCLNEKMGVNPPGGVWQETTNCPNETCLNEKMGVNPPGGVWQETTNCPNETCLNETGVNPPGGVWQETTNCPNETCLNETGVNPPGGVWQENTNCTNCLNETAICKTECRKAGTAIYASRPIAFHFFLASNTLALTSSVVVMFSLTYKFPYYLELWAAILGMLATYASAVFAISPEESVRFGALIGAGVVPLGFRLLVHIYKWLGIKA